MKITERYSGATIQVKFYRRQTPELACLPWKDVPSKSTPLPWIIGGLVVGYLLLLVLV